MNNGDKIKTCINFLFKEANSHTNDRVGYLAKYEALEELDQLIKENKINNILLDAIEKEFGTYDVRELKKEHDELKRQIERYEEQETVGGRSNY